jgi:arylsulfatase
LIRAALAVSAAGAFYWAVTTPPVLASNPTLRAPGEVVLVVVDALRADFLYRRDFPQPVTPNIDELAADGVLFTNAYSNSNWTKPAVAALFTGLWPSETGVLRMYELLPDDSVTETSLSPSPETLAEGLAARGYATAGFVNNPHLDAAFGFDRGFGHYEQGALPCEEIVERYLSWRSGHRDNAETFAYLHFLEPHAPYNPPPPYAGMFGSHEAADRLFAREGGTYDDWAAFRDEVNGGGLKLSPGVVEGFRNLYAGEVARCDAAIGRLLAGLRERGAYEEALVVVTADHGENLYEHSVLEHLPTTFFEEQIRVPLVVKFPRSWRCAGVRVDQPVQLIDVTATLSATTTGEVSGRGRSLAGPSMSGRHEKREIVTEAAGGFVVRFGALKALFKRGESLKIHRLIDIDADPGERADILARKPSFAQRALKQAQKWDAFVSARAPEGRGGGASEEELKQLRERLRALGYLN